LRIAVIGSKGQLGRDLCPILPGEVLEVDRSMIDLEKRESIQEGLDRIGADIVINCAAYNLVDKAESEPEPAMRVNAWAPAEMAKWCHSNGRYLVHFSTDYLFGQDETRTKPYVESDLPGPVSQYGVSKLAGEHLVRAYCKNHCIIRTCGLYGVWGSGGKGGNFVETMLRVAGQGKPLRVVADQFCTPTYTKDLSAVVAELLPKQPVGTLHLTSSGSCNWHEFASTIFELSGLKPALTAIPSSEYPVPARRPLFSVLISERLEKIGIHAPRHWRQALAEYLKERQLRSSR
jgi:dTDP-4-dehydrorhamnose reductase